MRWCNAARADAILSGRCFWGVQRLFKRHFQLNDGGALDVRAGYVAAGPESNAAGEDGPTYEEVCKTGAGYIEVVEIEFDPTKVTYAELAEFFWRTHESTDKGRLFWVDKEGKNTETRGCTF